MNSPTLSVVIPTHNRPHLLPLAVQSALDQTFQDLEVIVVDDASTELVVLPDDPRLRVIRLSTARGGAGARNVGTEAAQGRWITYLDDDDRLLPHMVATSLEALAQATLPPPVAVISGIEVINAQGQFLHQRFPPTARPRGCYFALEELESGKSYNTKQTLVVERDVILKMGGWDETFRSRVHSELFLRLNPVCSIVGLPVVTYQLYKHGENQVSKNPALRQHSFEQLIQKHRAAFEAHPKMFAKFVYDHAQTSYEQGQVKAAAVNWFRAMKLSPRYTLGRIADPLRERLHRSYVPNVS
jgi:glycosyltransferase involved in cell wall biosynthesis